MEQTFTPNQLANMQLVNRVGALMVTGFAEPDDDVFADDFVWHYFNAHLPELAGDHHGVEGLREFFERLGGDSGTLFHVEPHSLTPHGDELLVSCVTNTLTLGDDTIEFEAVVVWRAVDGRIQEAWDIPAVNTIRSAAT